MYNSPEERALIERARPQRRACPASRWASARRFPSATDAAGAAAQFGLDRPFVVYVGRIDVNKGCEELFDYFTRYCAHQRTRSRPGADRHAGAAGAVPPRIRHLGYVSDQDKFDVIAARRSAGHAVALREPVDGDARGLGARPSRCSPTDAATSWRASASAATPACSSKRPRVRGACSRRLLDDPTLAAELGQNGRALLRRPLRLAGDRARVPGHVRSPDGAGPGRRRRSSRTGWLDRRRRRLPPAAAAVRRRAAGPAAECRGGQTFRQETHREACVHHAALRRRHLITGPEHACRLLAEHISRPPRRRRLTTCARDRADVEERVPRRPGPRARRHGSAAFR